MLYLQKRLVRNNILEDNSNLYTFMKLRFTALVALAVCMVSCHIDFGILGTGGEVDVRLTVDIAELDTRGLTANQGTHDSAVGAINYLEASEMDDIYHLDWNEVDLRYMLEVYEVAESYDGATPIISRKVAVVDSYESVTFDLRLESRKEYRFVAFADFVAEDSASDDLTIEGQHDIGLHHTIGNTLSEISIKDDAINDESSDAYFAAKNITINRSGSQNLGLSRPYAKLRIVASDLAQLASGVQPKSVKVTYPSVHPSAFNAVDGSVNCLITEQTATFESEYVDNVRYNMTNHIYNASYDARNVTDENSNVLNTHITLLTDYILVQSDAQPEISLEMEVTYNDNTTSTFASNVKIARNRITSIVGNVLTEANQIDIMEVQEFAKAGEFAQSSELIEVLTNGGELTLTENMFLSEPTTLRGNAVIKLNGQSITYIASNEGDKHGVMTRVESGSSLTFEGDGAVNSTGIVAIVNDGAEIHIHGGDYFTEDATLFRSNGGNIYIYDGVFEASEHDGGYHNTLSHSANNSNGGCIEVSGGRFYKYNPARSGSSDNFRNFVKQGFDSFVDGDYYMILDVSNDYIIKDDLLEAYSVNGVTKWMYLVNNVAEMRSLSLKLMTDIELPQYALVANDELQNYDYDLNSPITVTDGVPSASNWIPVCANVATLSDPYSGHIDGQGVTIRGVRINRTGDNAGLIGFMYDDSSVRNLVIEDAVIYGSGTNTGAVVGRAQSGTTIENVHVRNSMISGENSVGGIAGRNYRRVGGAQGQGYNEGPAVIIGCSTDAATQIKGGQNCGGIVGYNYGAVVIECKNYADVTGYSAVGGIAGYSRDYHHNADGYVVACTSYGDATLTSTAKNGSVGGIIGHTLQDSNHENTRMPIVACTSYSELTGTNSPKKGCFIGYGGSTTVIASIATSNGSNKILGTGYGSSKAVYIYGTNVAGTDAEVEAMNAEIAAYNETAPVEAQCNHQWVVTAYLPKLQ